MPIIICDMEKWSRIYIILIDQIQLHEITVCKNRIKIRLVYAFVATFSLAIHSMIYLTYFVLSNVLTADHDDNNLKLVQEAVNITNEYYNHQRETHVVWGNDHSEDVSYFLIKLQGPVMLTPIFFHNNSVTSHEIKHFGHQIVFFSTDLEEFKQFVNFISGNIRDHIRLVLVVKDPISESSNLEAFNVVAWQNNLADIVIIYNNSTNNKISVSTYFPYNNNVCGNFIPVSLEPGDNMFPKKFVNFNQCSIRISATPHTLLVDLDVENGTVTRFSGNDASILKIIMTTINATFKGFKLPGYGYSTNGITSGGFNDLVNNKTDILIPSGFLTLDRYLAVLPSHGYYDPRIRWIGPKRRAMYQWIRLVMPFVNNVSPFLCLAFFGFVVVAIIIRRRTSPRRHQRDSLSFQAFSLLVGQGVMPVTNVPLLNNIFLLWIWFCFILRIAYQGVLVHCLHKTLLEPKFGLLSEAVTQVNAFGGLRSFLDYYRGTPLEKGFVIMPRAIFFSYLNRTVEGERFLLVSDSYLIHAFRRSFQVLDQPVGSSLSCFYMRPGWPAALVIDSILVRLLEAGITEKIYNMNNDVRETEVDKNEYHRLNMSVVGSCFFVITFMWFVCTTAFVVEIIYHRYANK